MIGGVYFQPIQCKNFDWWSGENIQSIAKRRAGLGRGEVIIICGIVFIMTEDASLQRKVKERRHRFQGTEERIEAEQFALQLHRKRSNVSTQGAEFHEELAFQAEMCTHRGFQSCYYGLRKITNSTAQLLHHLDEVVQKLRDTLQQSVQDDEVVKAVLVLVGALSTDLGDECFHYLALFINDMVPLIDTSKPELSAAVFKTLTILFQTHTKHLLREQMKSIRHFFAPLLGHAKLFVREFAAETFAILFRQLGKGPIMKDFLTAFFHALMSGSGITNAHLQHGISHLFYCMVKNVQGQFHSRMEEVWYFLLAFCAEHPHVYDILLLTSESMQEFTSSQKTSLGVWTGFQRCLRDHPTVEILQLTTSWVKFKRGRLISDVFHSFLLEWWPHLVEQHPELSVQTLELLQVYVPLLQNQPENLRGILDLVYRHYRLDELVSFTSTMLEKLDVIDQSLLPALANFGFVQVKSHDETLVPTCLDFIHRLVLEHAPALKQSTVQHQLEQFLLDWISSSSKRCRDEWIWSGLVSLQSLLPIQSPDLTSKLRLVFTLCPDTDVSRHLLACQAIKCIENPPEIWTLLNLHPSSPSMLELVASMENHCTHLTSAQKQELGMNIVGNLDRPSHAIRRWTLEVLKKLDPTSGVVQWCSEIEMLEPLLKNERQMIQHLERIEAMVGPNSSLNDMNLHIAGRAMFGFFQIKLATIWPNVQNVLSALAKSRFQIFWTITLAKCQQLLRPQHFQLIESSSRSNKYSNNRPSKLNRKQKASFEQWHLLEQTKAESNECTDVGTQQECLWSLMKDLVSVLESKKASKEILAMFYSFLQYPYSQVNVDIFSCLTARGSDHEQPQPPQPSLEWSGKLIQNQLLAFLHVMSKFRQLKKHFENKTNEWTSIFHFFLLHPDEEIGTSSLQCLFHVYPSALRPYEQQLLAFVDNTQYREMMTKFSIAPTSDAIVPDHRRFVVPVILRILYAKIITRKGRSNKDTLASRRVSILAYLNACAQHEIDEFMSLLFRPFTDAQGKGAIFTSIVDIGFSKKMGFLHLCGDFVAHFGPKILPYLSTFLTILTQLLQQHPTQFRTLVLQRLAEIFPVLSKANEGHDMVSSALDLILPELESTLPQLPHILTSEGQTPAVLVFLVALATSTKTHPCASFLRQALPHLIASISTISCASTMDHMVTLFDAVESILPEYYCALLSAFTKRFQTFQHRLTLSECQFLCRLSERMSTSRESKDNPLDDLGTTPDVLLQLFFPMLKSRQIDPGLILELSSNLIPLVAKPQNIHFTFCLGTGKDALESRELREALVNIQHAIARRMKTSEAFSYAAKVLEALHCFRSTKIHEPDVPARLEALEELRAQDFAPLVEAKHALGPVLAHVVYMLQEDEYTLRHAAQKTLGHFLNVVIRAQGNNEKEEDLDLASRLKDMSSCVVWKNVRHLFHTSSMACRRECFQLLSAYADGVRESTTELKLPYASLVTLRNVDDPEVDFFYNIAHIQVHRRQRALTRLAYFLSTNEVLEASILIHLFIPVFQQMMVEKDLGQGLVLALGQVMNQIAKHLTWSHYFNSLRFCFQQIARSRHAEEPLLTVACEMIDAFHFTAELANDDENALTPQSQDTPKAQEMKITSEESTIQRQLRLKLVPMTAQFLTLSDPKDSGEEAKFPIIRKMMVLAYVKLLHCLSPHAFTALFPKVLIQIMQSLKAKEEKVRTSARDTLVKLCSLETMMISQSSRPAAASLLPTGVRMFPQILHELHHTLREKDSYQPILCYTLHAILQATCPHVQCPAPSSLLLDTTIQPEEEDTLMISGLIPFHRCMPKIMPLLLSDIVQLREHTQSKRKEAKAMKSFDSVELLAQTINLFRTSLPGPNDNEEEERPSLPSFHELMLEPLVQQFHSVGSNLKLQLKLREALRRMALGMGKNPSFEKSHFCCYLFQLFEQCNPPTSISVEDQLEASETQASKKKTLPTSLTWIHKSATSVASEQRKVQPLSLVKVLTQPKMTGFGSRPVTASTKSQQQASLQDEMMEFALLVLYQLLKSGRFSVKKKSPEELASDLALLDPFVHVLANVLLLSKNPRIFIQGCKVLILLLAWPCPSFQRTSQKTFHALLFHALHAKPSNDIRAMVFRTFGIFFRQFPQTFTALFQPKHWRVLFASINLSLTTVDSAQSTTLALLKSILAQQIIVSELYDLMETQVLRLLVQHPEENCRHSCGLLYLTFLLDYPLGAKRLEQQLQRLFQNLAYEYESGRVSILTCVLAFIQKCPAKVIEEYGTSWFYLLMFHFQQEKETRCRELYLEVYTSLFRQLNNSSSAQHAQIWTAVCTWWNSPQAAMRSMAAVLTNAMLPFLAETQLRTLAGIWTPLLSQDQDWSLQYQILRSLEFLTSRRIPDFLLDSSQLHLMQVLTLSSAAHPWMHQKTLRIYGHVLAHAPEVIQVQGFTVIQQCCQILEDACDYSDAWTEPWLECVLGLSQLVPTQDQTHEHQCVDWIFTRLSYLARKPLNARRLLILKYFTAMIVGQDMAFCERMLLAMLNPVIRMLEEGDGEKDPKNPSELLTFAQEFVQLIEAKMEPNMTTYLSVYQQVKDSISKFRSLRKQKQQLEVVQDPMLASQRKLRKNLHKSQQKSKRKMQTAYYQGKAPKQRKM